MNTILEKVTINKYILHFTRWINRFHHSWMEREGFLDEWVMLCLVTRLAESHDTKSLTSARCLLFPPTRDEISISCLLVWMS